MIFSICFLIVFITESLNLQLDVEYPVMALAVLSTLLLCSIPIEIVITNQLYHGFKHFIRMIKLRCRLEKQLIDAGLSIKRNCYIEVPKIEIHFSNDLCKGVLKIRNTIKNDRRLDNSVLSPALGDYVVEQHYMSDNQDYYIYELYDSTKTYKQVFNCFDEFIGYSRTISEYKLFLDQRYQVDMQHFLICGQTGSGKTYSLYSLLFQMLTKETSYDIYFADPKASSLSVFANLVGAINIGENLNEITDILRLFSAEMQKRKIELKDCLNSRLDTDYRSFGLKPLVLIIDEYSSYITALNNREKSLRDEVKSIITEIVLQGRQLGVFLIIAMQKSDASIIDTFIRDNLTCKCVLGNAEPTTYVTTFAHADIPNKNYQKGEGVFTEPSIAPEPRIVNFPYLRFDINEACRTIHSN